MIEREQTEEYSINPLFKKYRLQSGFEMYFNILNGEIVFELPKCKTASGGLLCDEMGLGKTAQVDAFDIFMFFFLKNT